MMTNLESFMLGMLGGLIIYVIIQIIQEGSDK